ncbi:MAG TPA: helix-turn-helix transcriptional regulator [Stellaceae bacterium]|nr:helix-turn-helix transcriptional regulator [Stellaceae bacterium]
MTTGEVAAYLRLRERKIYDLVRRERIPCSRVTGKLLFPKHLIDLWVAQNTEFAGPELRAAPPVAAGSHDPLLEWALRQSGSGLAMLAGGSEDGVQRLAAGQAVLAGLHIRDPHSGEYNIAAVRDIGRIADVVLIEWAEREQGLVVAAGNPLGLRRIADLAEARVRVARRQEGAGAHILLHHLLAREGLRIEALNLVTPAMLTETDLAAAVLDGKADCGFAIRAAAQRFRLDFIPLHRERFDLAMRRRDYFEPALQALLAFAASGAFRQYAAELGGYDVARTGRVVYNA